MTTRVLITKPLIAPAIAAVREAGFEPFVQPIRDRRELLAAAGAVEAMVTMLTDKLDAEFFAAAKGGPLRVVANYAVGYDNIDVAAAEAAGVRATNTPDVLTEATAEMAWALVFAAARRIVEGDALVRGGQWRGWEPTQLVGAGVTGATVGVVGAGRIGRAFAAMGRGFGIRVLYYARTAKPEFEAETGARRVELDELMSTSRIVSIHLPGGPKTKGLIGARELALLSPGAILVNTGRGTVVDEEALVEGLKRGHPAAAGLDVYEKEPVVHPGLFALPNVVLAPHLGSATVKSRTLMAARCCANIRAALAGDRPPDALWPKSPA